MRGDVLREVRHARGSLGLEEVCFEGRYRGGDSSHVVSTYIVFRALAQVEG